ncbi:MAG: nucleotidyltransferase domain-containing protein [Bacteroidales bacterium]|nr:nucleotidyltransferase domain-containing protein [Bacteroidales bacterium]
MNEKIIKQITLQFFPTCIILLFGSRARNEYTEDSDYDLLIITNNELSIQEKREYKAKIRKLLAKAKIPADILIQSNTEIETKKLITGHIVKQALKEGIQI